MIASEIKALIGAALLTLGISAPPGAFAGGMFLAISAAIFLLILMPEKRASEAFAIVGLTSLLATLAAMLQLQFFPEWPLQPKMLLCGVLGRTVFLAYARMSSRVVERAADVVDEAASRIGIDKGGEK